jgi:diguanylate cyclase (GGDEF)-like protein
MQNSGCTYHEAEDHVLGFNHMAVGKSLIESWGLPELFYAPIGCHHQPEKLSTTSSEIEMLTKILHLSTLYIDLFDSKDTCFTLQLIEHHTKNYEFSDNLKIDKIGSQIYQHTQQIFPLFEISIEDENHYTELLESARKEIINLANDLMHRVVQQQAEIERLREQIIRDGMTPLINYQYFYELLNQEIYRSKRYKFPVSIIIAVIDDIKSINEKFGQTAGDYVIKMVADCLRKELRQSDHVARYGGDEFGLILPETGPEGGLQAAERLREAISSMNVVYNKKSIACSLSFGVASLLPDQDVTRNGFIKMAEKALSRAKAKGKNQCVAFKDAVSKPQ